jgi:ABC-type multidrug transport system fused ATPase/permease subunit
VSRAKADEDLPPLLAGWRAVFGVAWRASPGGALGTTLGWFLATLIAGPVLGLSLQHAVGSRGFGSPVWISLMLVSVITPEALLGITDHVREIVRRRGEQRISEEIIRAALRPNGIEHLENPQFADRVAFLRGEASQIATVFGTVAGQAGVVIGFLLSLALLLSVSLWLLVPVIGAALLGIPQMGASRKALTVQEGKLKDQRMADHMVRLSTSEAAAPDIRMLGIGDWVTRRFDQSVSAVEDTMLRSERRHVLITGLSGGVQAVMLVGGLGLLLWLADIGQVKPGGVVLGVTLLQTVLESARGLATNGSFVMRTGFAARRFLWLLRYPDGVPTPAVPVPVPARLSDGIHLDRLSFSYPFSDHEVLHDVSIQFPAGSTVALIGNNGAGKSTLVKLLCRYYDPTAGRITLDGTDLRAFKPDAWRERITAGFQDFVRFEFPADESIGVSRVALLDEDQVPLPERRQLITEAAREGQTAQFIEKFPGGYSTQFGRQFGGEQLSEGQWQRVAMSRMFLRRDVLLILLDEPTAALDPRAEHELFARFAEQTSRARAAGAVTVLVSHRFSTVSMADHIIVLDGGRVVEAGSHTSLMAADGMYRRSFELQARHYQPTGPAAAPKTQE